MSNVIARAKVIDEATGNEVPVDVRTCAEAVTCAEGKTMQQHLQAIADHMSNAAAHPTAEKRLEWDSKETPSGAQAKATAAKNAAIAAAQSLSTNARDEAISESKKYSDTKSENAKNDAIRAAAVDVTEKLKAYSFGTANIANDAVTTDKIAYGAVTADKIAYGVLPVDRVIREGRSGNWTYHYWESGKVEAWCKISVAAILSKVFAFTTDVGERALLKATIDAQKYPDAIDFPTTPKVFFTVECSTPTWCGTTAENGTDESTPEIAVYAWSDGDDISKTIAVNYYCVSQ